MVVNAAINHSDSNSCSVQRVLLPGDIGQNRRRSIIKRSSVSTIWSHVSYIRMLLQKIEQLDRYAVRRCLDMPVFPSQPGSIGGHHLKMPGLRRVLELNHNVDRTVLVDGKSGEIRGNFAAMLWPRTARGKTHFGPQ